MYITIEILELLLNDDKFKTIVKYKKFINKNDFK